MKLAERLALSPWAKLTRAEIARYELVAEAKIESGLYRAGVPEKFYRGLIQQLSDFTESAIGSALLLYDQLEQDHRLSLMDRIKLIPALAHLADTHGAEVHRNNQHIDTLLWTYLTNLDEPSFKLKGRRLKDRHTSERYVIYGDASADIHYGTRQGGYGDTLRRKIPASRTPSHTMVRKAQELVNSANLGKWKEAVERYHDLIRQKGHLFYGIQTHRQFLYDIGSIIKGESIRYKVTLIGIDDYGFPIAYNLSPTLEMPPFGKPKEKPSVGEIKPPFVNRISKKTKIVPSNGFGKKPTNQDVVVLGNPHPRLERIIARIS